MTSFRMQNSSALLVGAGSALASHLLLAEADWPTLATIALSGYLGVHLPNIQCPSSPSYQIVRNMSALIALLIPMLLYGYRPTDLGLAWVASYLLHKGLWWIVDRVSLYRDYTRTLMAIMLLPLVVTACAYASTDEAIMLPVFLAASSGYVIWLIIDHRSQHDWKTRILPGQ